MTRAHVEPRALGGTAGRDSAGWTDSQSISPSVRHPLLGATKTLFTLAHSTACKPFARPSFLEGRQDAAGMHGLVLSSDPATMQRNRLCPGMPCTTTCYLLRFPYCVLPDEVHLIAPFRATAIHACERCVIILGRPDGQPMPNRVRPSAAIQKYHRLHRTASSTRPSDGRPGSCYHYASHAHSMDTASLIAASTASVLHAPRVPKRTSSDRVQHVTAHLQACLTPHPSSLGPLATTLPSFPDSPFAMGENSAA